MATRPRNRWTKDSLPCCSWSVPVVLRSGCVAGLRRCPWCCACTWPLSWLCLPPCPMENSRMAFSAALPCCATVSSGGSQGGSTIPADQAIIGTWSSGGEIKIPERKPMLIAGADSPFEAGIAPLLSINPATGQTNYEVAAAGPETVDFAVRNAASACADRGWREMLPMQRARILLGIADGIERDGAMLARLQMQENGKVWSECSRQVQSAAATFRYYAGVCEVTGSEVPPARGNSLSMTLHEPYGVVAPMTPWNSPMTMEAQKIAPALAAANPLILNPSHA